MAPPVAAATSCVSVVPATAAASDGIEDVVECAGEGFYRGMQAGVAGEFEAEVFLVYPDFAAVLTGQIRSVVKVIGETAVVAGGFGMPFEGFRADGT